ncbi:FecR family protein [Chitinophaga sp. Hz27]|uniref:FecR family protein n=1 Tax=Chitinophaga sp. Hz27 TaxID=3347169 RepID=UPI0035DCC792
MDKNTANLRGLIIRKYLHQLDTADAIRLHNAIEESYTVRKMDSAFKEFILTKKTKRRIPYDQMDHLFVEYLDQKQKETKAQVTRIGVAATIAIVVACTTIGVMQNRKTSVSKTLAKNAIVITDVNGNQFAFRGDTTLQVKDGNYVISNNTLNLTTTPLACLKSIKVPNQLTFNVVLPDGSSVQMNSGSEITLNENFTKLRTVEYNGEGYFKIAQNDKAPFHVTCRNAAIQVLGTSFNVNTYHANPVVSLITGAIRVNSSNDTHTLQPGTQSVILPDGKQLLQESDSEDVISWTNGIVKFQNAPLSEIIEQVTNWYDYDLQIADNAKNLKLTTSVNKNNSLISFISSLKNTQQLDYTQEGNTIKIYKK